MTLILKENQGYATLVPLDYDGHYKEDFTGGKYGIQELTWIFTLNASVIRTVTFTYNANVSKETATDDLGNVWTATFGVYGQMIGWVKT